MERLIDIQPDGEANFCVDFPDYSIGNVKQASIEAALEWAAGSPISQLQAGETLGGMLPVRIEVYVGILITFQRGSIIHPLVGLAEIPLYGRIFMIIKVL